MTVEIAEGAPPIEQLTALYRAVRWTAYADDPPRLERAVGSSAIVLSARDGGALVGFARALSDGAHVTFLSDLLVQPDRQRSGVGRALLEAVRARSSGRLVLLTDRDGPRVFYRRAGLEDAADLGLVCYVSLLD